MALIKEGLWDIVNGTEADPGEEAEARTKFLARRNKALATIMPVSDRAGFTVFGRYRSYRSCDCLEDSSGAIPT